MWFTHDGNDGYLDKVLSQLEHSVSKNKERYKRTPLAVRIGLAFSLGNKAFLYSSGIALMISTSLGTPPKANFLLIFERMTFRETVSFASWALMSSAAIPEVTLSSCSAWDGPRMQFFNSLHLGVGWRD